MEGRSGGTMIAVGSDWVLKEHNPDTGLELEADKECYCSAYIASRHGAHEFLAICYYGHPAKRIATLRDLGRIDQYVHATALPVILMGDFNIGASAQEMGLHSLRDVAATWAARIGERTSANVCGNRAGNPSRQDLD